MKQLNKSISAAGFTLGLSLISTSISAQISPQLNLFPTSVVEAVSDSYERTKELEQSLKASIDLISEQHANYKAAHCENDDGDAGCEQLKKAMLDPFGEILHQINEQIPDMRAAIESASSGIGRSLKRNIGRSLNPKQLQDIMMGKSRTRRLKRSTQNGLTNSLKAINSALRTNAGNKSHPAFAAEIYMDTLAAQEELAILQDNVAYLLTTSRIRTAMGGLSEKDLSVIAGVRSLFYGEDDGCASSCLPDPILEEDLDSNLKELREGE